jgi:hypothetical protein
MPFKNTDNKATIRSNWDLALIKRWHAEVGRPLAYFGLPGPDILDLLEWREYLGKRTGVESPGNTLKQREQADEVIGRLNMNIMAHGISSRFQLLKADIEDVIIEGFDTYGTAPQLNDGGSAYLARFRYDVVNLDFNSGLDYRRKAGARRIAAIKKLFDRQQGHSFLLFLTVSVRDNLDSQINEYLRELQGRNHGPGWHELMEWHLSWDDKAVKLKGVVPSLVRNEAESRMFRCSSLPPIVYNGYKTQMVHFAFKLEKSSGYLRAWSNQDDKALLELPLLRCESGQFQLLQQHPGFDGSKLEECLGFLPPGLRTSILSQLPAIEEAG